MEQFTSTLPLSLLNITYDIGKPRHSKASAVCSVSVNTSTKRLFLRYWFYFIPKTEKICSPHFSNLQNDAIYSLRIQCDAEWSSSKKCRDSEILTLCKLHTTGWRYGWINLRNTKEGFNRVIALKLLLLALTETCYWLLFFS